MTFRPLRISALRLAVPVAACALLSACALAPEGDAICADGSPAEGSWPHCAPNDPGGMRDDRVNPRG